VICLFVHLRRRYFGSQQSSSIEARVFHFIPQKKEKKEKKIETQKR
jgi:hypothetical protein